MEKEELTTEVPNSAKGADYIIRHAVAIMDRHTKRFTPHPGVQNEPQQRLDDGGTPDIWRNVENVRAARYVARSLNSGKPWRDQHTLRDSGNNEVVTRSNTWAPSRILGKYLALFVEQMMRNTSLRVDVLDPEVREKNAKAKFKVLAKVKESQNPQFKSLMAAAGMPDAAEMPADMPQSEAEWAEWASGVYKDDQSRTIEILNNGALTLNDYWLKIRPRIAEELRDAGIACLLPVLDPYGIPRIHVYPYESCLLPDTNDNWANPQFGAVQTWMTIDEIAVDAGPAMSSEVLREMSRVNQWDRTRKQRVWKVWFVDTLTDTYATDPMGNRVELPEGASEEGMSDIKRQRYKVVFQCNLVDTSSLNLKKRDGRPWEDRYFAYNPGLADNQIKYRDGMGQARIPLIAVAVDMEEMRVRSLTQRAIDMFEPFEALWFELKKLTSKIIPPGQVLDIEAMEEGHTIDGVVYGIRENIRLLRDEGTVLAKRADITDPLGGKGEKVMVLPGYVPPFMEILQSMDYILRGVEQALGFNEATAARDTGERTAVRNLQLIAQGTTAALSPWVRAMDTLELELYRRIYGCWQNAYRIFGKTKSIPGQIFGDAVERNVELTIDNDPESLGFSLEVGATAQDLDILAAAMDQAIQADPKAVTIADRMYVMDIARKNVRLAARILTSRIDRNIKRSHEMQKEMVALDQQKIAQAAEAQMQQIAQKIQMEADSKIALEQFKSQVMAEVKEREYQHKMEIEQLKAMLNASVVAEELDSDERIAEGLNKSNEAMNRESVEASEREARIKAGTSVETARIAADARRNAASKPPVGKKK